jgi:hypothetical protein
MDSRDTPDTFDTEYRLTWRALVAAVLVSIPLWALLLLIGWALANLRFS